VPLLHGDFGWLIDPLSSAPRRARMPIYEAFGSTEAWRTQLEIRNRIQMKGLTLLESEVMRLLLDRGDQFFTVLRRQLDHATVKSRELTGVGFFTRFEVPANIEAWWPAFVKAWGRPGQGPPGKERSRVCAVCGAGCAGLA
jgi:hypothetical protein